MQTAGLDEVDGLWGPSKAAPRTNASRGTSGTRERLSLLFPWPWPGSPPAGPTACRGLFLGFDWRPSRLRVLSLRLPGSAHLLCARREVSLSLGAVQEEQHAPSSLWPNPRPLGIPGACSANRERSLGAFSGPRGWRGKRPRDVLPEDLPGPGRPAAVRILTADGGSWVTSVDAGREHLWRNGGSRLQFRFKISANDPNLIHSPLKVAATDTRASMSTVLVWPWPRAAVTVPSPQ